MTLRKVYIQLKPEIFVVARYKFFIVGLIILKLFNLLKFLKHSENYPNLEWSKVMLDTM